MNPNGICFEGARLQQRRKRPEFVLKGCGFSRAVSGPEIWGL
jgi:hypothetical protein